MTQQENLLINYILIGKKLNALKLTLSDKQLDIYNNYILDEAEKIKPELIKILKNQEEVDVILKAFLI